MSDYKKMADDKARIIRHILNNWNNTQEDNWTITKTGTMDICEIRRSGENRYTRYGIHGSLLTDIAFVANVYRWTFSVLVDDKGQIYIHI